MKLVRHPQNPLLLPDHNSDWESVNVFNPAVVYDNGLFHMWYRAQGLDWVSRIGYAVSEDGVCWNRLRKPVLAPSDGTDSRGLEDPRVVKLDDAYYMTYTAYGREYYGTEPTHAGGGILPMIARSENGITWERLGPIVRGEDNKDHALFPQKIGGRYVALHRRWPTIWLAFSDDLLTWREQDMAPILVHARRIAGITRALAATALLSRPITVGLCSTTAMTGSMSTTSVWRCLT